MANNTLLMKKRDISQVRNELYQLLTSKEYKESCMLFEQEVKSNPKLKSSYGKDDNLLLNFTKFLWNACTECPGRAESPL